MWIIFGMTTLDYEHTLSLTVDIGGVIAEEYLSVTDILQNTMSP